MLRQTARHAEAVPVDALALRLAATAEERAHALIGLAADAVGLGDAARCRALLVQARPAATSWRAEVRWRWVSAEHALLTEHPRAAAAHAHLARATAARAGAIRHEAKSMLFEGVALAEMGDARARPLLARALSRAAGIGATPVARAAQQVLEHHPGAREASSQAG